jgi:predicted permease
VSLQGSGRIGLWLEDFGRDLRHSIVALRRAPEFTLVALFTLALGIGANAAIFSVVNAVLLRPLPYPESSRLIRVFETYDHKSATGSVSVPNFLDWRRQVRSFEGLAAYQTTGMSLQGNDEAERVAALEASANLFQILRAKPLLGRTFTSEEEGPGRGPVVVLSEGLWRRRFGADPTILSRTVSLDGEPRTVIGVMPAGFQFPAGPRPADLWVPIAFSPEDTESRGNHFLNVVARLRPGISFERASAEMSSIAATLERQYPDAQAGRGIQLAVLRESVVRDVRTPLLLLLAAVGLLLLIACANIANLHLARAAARKREVAVRSALGATRVRLVRQHLTESLVLALAGAAAGGIVALVAVKVASPLLAPALPLGTGVHLDLSVLAFLLLAAVASGIAFGLLPALQAAPGAERADLAASATRTTAGASHRRLRDALVVAQLALSIVLLVGAGLTLRSFRHLLQTPAGLDARGVLTLRVAIPSDRSEPRELQERLLQPLLEAVRGIPGVASAGLISLLPLDSWGTNGDFWVDGQPQPAPGEAPIAELRVASPDYFKSLGIPVLAGREFAERDGLDGPRVAIINRALARKHFPGVDPVGRRLRRDVGDEEVYTVVGVVGDVRQSGLGQEPLPEITFPYGNPGGLGLPSGVTIAIRTTVAPASVSRAVRQAIRGTAPGQGVYAVRTMSEVIDGSLTGRRLAVWLIGAFGAVALALAAGGLYGVISYLVATRTREVGIRMALGADRGNVLRLVVGRGATLVGAGSAVGLLGALAATTLIARWLYGIGPRDPLTFVAVAALLAAVALLATYVPALRAAAVSPVEALRVD